MQNFTKCEFYTYYYHENMCERRVLDVDRLRDYLHKNNFLEIKNIKEADYVMFCACGMLAIESDRTIENLVKESKKKSHIIVFGCYPAMCSKIQYTKKIYYVPLSKTHLLNKILRTSYKIQDVVKPNVSKGKILSQDALTTWDPRLKLPYCSDVFSLIVSEGCSQSCSYCTIRYATGPLKSISINKIIENLKEGLKKGYKVFRFQCENLGVYGEDIDETLGDLLDALSAIEDNFTIDLPDLHPKGFIDYFDSIKKFASKKNVCLLHLPIQSANQRILNLMKRCYNIHEVEDKLINFLNKFPKIKIGTDIIAGNLFKKLINLSSTS